MKTRLTSATIEKVHSFICSLEGRSDTPESPEIDIMFIKADEGGMTLSGDDANRYRDCLESLIREIDDERISSNNIESFFQTAILTTLDIKEKRKDFSFEERLNIAIEGLNQSLSITPRVYFVYYPVYGLAEESLPIQLGNVKFCIFDETQLSLYSGVDVEKERKSEIENEHLMLGKSIKESGIVGKPIGLIKVNAFDEIAAEKLAEKKLTSTIEILNFYSDLIPYQKGYLYLPGDNQIVRRNVIVQTNGDEPYFSYGWNLSGSPIPFSLQKLIESDKSNRIGFSKIYSLISKKRNTFEERIITSIQWAGKATVKKRKEESFLLYAISLECLITPEKNRDEIGNRLRRRIGKILGKNARIRRKISNEICNLYDIRSNIVHDGSYEVTDADLSLLRAYSKTCILHIINEISFDSIKDINTYVQWLERPNPPK